MFCRWREIVAILFVSTLVLKSNADEPTKKSDPLSGSNGSQRPAQKFTAAKKAFMDASAALNKVGYELQQRNEQVSLQNKKYFDAYQARNRAMQAMLDAAQELAEAEPSTPAGFDAIVITMTNNVAPPSAMLKVLTEHYASSPKINQFLGRFYYAQETNELVALLTKVIARNPSRDIQAHATLMLARLKMSTKPDESERLLEGLLKKYEDMPDFEMTYGKRVRSNLFEVQNLRIGKAVPQIEGKDIDGKTFKLSDYRGKVVMLDFWGHW